MRLLTEAQIIHLEAEAARIEALRSAELWGKQIERVAENHQWEVRRLTGRAEDAERERDKYRGAYKRAIAKLKGYRKQLSAKERQLRAAGLAENSEPNADGTPSLDTAQAIFDKAVSEIPLMDDMSQNQVRLYIERELRTRGAKAGPEILEEVLAGDLQE